MNVMKIRYNWLVILSKRLRDNDDLEDMKSFDPDHFVGVAA
jgi:hypothetical protein